MGAPMLTLLRREQPADDRLESELRASAALFETAFERGWIAGYARAVLDLGPVWENEFHLAQQREVAREIATSQYRNGAR